jgi:3',5'-cyclic-AMP phosphodiesterase
LRPDDRQGDWIVILLDSSVPDSAAGTLGHMELRILEEILSRHPRRHALICLHHPVMAVGTGWLDPLMLSNADAFFEIIDRHPQVRGVLFGHIHQSFEAERNGVSILGTPSTCVQFLPHTREFALDSLPPAWRQLTLHRDGRIETRVHYLDDQLSACRSASR